MLNLMLDEGPIEELVKILVYGKPGTGKTTFGTSAPFPLILLSERQGLPHIRAAAKRLIRKICGILFMETLQDYRNVLRALNGDKNKPFVVIKKTNEADEGTVVFTSAVWPESVVLDSLTDACDRVTAEIREQSPQTVGSDGLPVDSERYYQVLGDRITKLIRAFRDTPVHVVFLCQLDDKMVGETRDKDAEKTRVVAPSLPMRKLPDVAAAAVNVVGITYRRRGESVKDQDAVWLYGVATVGPDYMTIKPCRPLRDFEVPDAQSWINRVNGKPDDTVAPPPRVDVDVSTAAAGDVTAAGLQEAAKVEPPIAAAKPADAPTGQQDAPKSEPEAKPEKATKAKKTPAGVADEERANPS